MNLRESWDAVIVGAGPGGAAAAYHLASLQRHVLLVDRRRFPRDKSCGDGLTPTAVRLLAEMEVLDKLPTANRVRGVRVQMRGRERRDFLYPTGRSDHDYGLVIPRILLDQAICQAAVGAGAVLHEAVEVTGLLSEDGRVVGVEAKDTGGEAREIRAKVVIAADGAGSSLARQAGLTATAPADFGSALRGYFGDIDGFDDLLEIYLPMTDITDRYLLPSYGWIFPTGRGSVNLGVGLFQRQLGGNLRGLFDRFVAELVATDRRFAKAQRQGPLLGAPLRFDFAPERCAVPGLLLVGDAAGLISPFTGEGISYALESGKMAAETVDICLRSPLGVSTEADDYRTLLEYRFAGYFEAGRRSSRRYVLLWHILDSTFDSDRPIHRLCRRMVLVPEATGSRVEDELFQDVGPLIPRHGLRVRDSLHSVGEILTGTVRKDWPFLSRLMVDQQRAGLMAFRPALMLLLAAEFGDPESEFLCEVAAALELGYFSFLAQSGVAEEDKTLPDREKSTNWGNKFAVLLSDFLLAKAHELSSVAGAAVTRSIAESVSRSCTGRVQEWQGAYKLDLAEDDHIAMLGRKTATLFELPCRLGAILAGANGISGTLARYGRLLGMAYALTDDIITMQMSDWQLDSVIASDVANGMYGLPVLRVLRERDRAGRHLQELLQGSPVDISAVTSLVRKTGVLEGVRQLAQSYAEDAISAVAVLPESPARTALENLSNYAITRDVPVATNLHDLL